MPIYTYECSSCQERKELNVKIADRDRQRCICKKELKRVITFTGIVFAPTAGGMK